MPTDLTANDVTADMERIFRPLTERALVPATRQDRDAGDRRGWIGNGWRRVTLAALATVLLTIAVLAIGYGRADEPAARTAEAAVAAPVAPAPVRSDTVPSPAPAATPFAALPTSPVDLAAVARPPMINPRPTLRSQARADDLAAGRARTRAEPPSQPAPTSRFGAATPPSPLEPSPRSVTAGTFAAVAPRTRAEASPTAPRCEPGSAEDRCIYQEVMTADARLRSAYDAARRAGVSRSLLSTASRYWGRALRDAEDDPDETIRHYEELADALDLERREIARAR